MSWLTPIGLLGLIGLIALIIIYIIKPNYQNKVISSKVIDTNGSGHGALAGMLSALDVDVLICGGIGGGAQMALAQAGIKLYGGVSGNADKAVEDYLNNSLNYDPEAKCDHHDHEHGEGHTCGEHGCGGNCHGHN